ncbi:MAG: TonB family protein [Saprospiraceae bacterium]
MRKYVAQLALLLCLAANLTGQTTTDTTIYEVAESMPMPLLARCMPDLHPGWTEDSLRRCAESQLLSVVTKNIRYPEEARKENKEGTVVTSFVVEKTGRISDIRIIKDIGGGCGDEAARVLAALDEAGLRWVPAKREGKPVRMRHALPIRFRLQEALPYYLRAGGDTVYVAVDIPPAFKGDEEGLMTFVLNNLRYPASYRDSCKAGVIELSLIIRPNGRVEIENQLDFSALGMDFQYEAIRLANHMSGQWNPALYHDRPVATVLPLRTLFKSDQPGCKAANEGFDKAMLLANEAGEVSDQGQPEKALEKWNESVALQPNNTEILYHRASALLAVGKREDACADFNRIKALLGTTWFEQLRTLVCGK